MHAYPKNANDYFVLKAIDLPPNFIINFWHKYDLDSFHAGGIVEFSTDTGTTWVNVVNCAGTNNFYPITDTLFNGANGFTGKSKEEVVSSFQFITCIPEKSTSTTCFLDQAVVYFRFRMVSDTTTDSLSGWMIDSIQLQNPGCIPGSGAVKQLTRVNDVVIYPNPATNEIRVTSSANIDQITISDLLGQPIYSHEYKSKRAQVNIDGFARGVYLIKVNGTEVQRFVKQ